MKAVQEQIIPGLKWSRSSFLRDSLPKVVEHSESQLSAYYKEHQGKQKRAEGDA